jgi:hypothetical protein
MHTDQLKKKLRDILISEGITDESELNRKIEAYLAEPRRDLLKYARPENRVYPTEYGFMRLQDMEPKKKE